MPLYHDFTDENARILFWKYDDEDQFSEDLVDDEDAERVAYFHPKKKKEYLMIRKMLNSLLPEHKILYKTIGQPYLWPTDYFISITHSFPFASIAVSTKRVGIDIEKVMPKIFNVRDKFLHPSELLWTRNESEIDLITIIWVIKEALYKLHPSKFWSLKDHYEVEKFSLENLSEVHCRVFDDGFEDRYVAKVSKVEDFYFAIIEENHQINYKIPPSTPF